MYKAGICGHFGGNKKYFDGQTVKTKILTEELQKIFGAELIGKVDTFGWRNNPVNHLLKCYNLLRKSENIIILPAHNGVKVFVPLFLLLNLIFNHKLHYVVIGGWLPKLLEEKQKLIKKLGKFDGIYVETQSMVDILEKKGLKNVRHLPNFKRLNILKENELEYAIGEPYKLCTFSRVMKEKGIEDAIDAVKFVNKAKGRVVYALDIYGQVDEKYMERFQELKNDFPEYISYKGIVDYSGSVRILKGYFVLLFPTHFRTEGIPGTIIDAYASGVPVLASNWVFANEIVSENRTGYIYDFMQKLKLKKLLLELCEDPKKINEMKKNCIKMASLYTPETVIGEFIKYL